MTLSNNLTSAQQIINVLRMIRAYSRIIIIINICEIIFEVLKDVQAIHIDSSDTENTLKMVRCVFMIAAFVQNSLTLCYYLQMGRFFINLLQENTNDKRKFMLFVWIVLCTIFISNAAENLFYPVEDLLKAWNIYSLSSE